MFPGAPTVIACHASRVPTRALYLLAHKLDELVAVHRRLRGSVGDEPYIREVRTGIGGAPTIAIVRSGDCEFRLEWCEGGVWRMR